MIEKAFFRQPVSEDAISRVNVARTFVLEFTKKFGAPSDVEQWKAFFDEHIPNHSMDKSNSPGMTDTYLHKLYNEYGGPPRRKNRDAFKPRANINGFSEALVFPGAPWSKGERDACAQYAVSKDSRFIVKKKFIIYLCTPDCIFVA